MVTSTFQFPNQVGFTILFAALATSSFAQVYRPSPAQCEKYCFADCKEYNDENSRTWIWGIVRTVHIQNEYTDCVTANLNCNCESRFSFSNPLLLLGLITFCILLIIVFYRLYRRCHNTESRTNNMPTSIRIYAHPVISPANTISNGNFGTANAPTYNTFQTHNGVTDTPPEYLPPPSYYECAANPTKGELK
ncbi:unnamed protein product [Orchesella dallaii]|uniref:Transmembrane protein n=1 Tax=Orchesella dallaii TaxID=48710 RepID=A0ABP1REF5_9HEXA